MTASAECSPGLWRRLTDDRLGFFDAVAELRGDPEAAREIAASLPALERHNEPAGAKAVVAALAPLVTLYGVTDRSEAEWKTFWGFYTRVLAEIPAEALKAGVEDYVANPASEFFPKPGPLLALCNARAAPLRIAISRARRVVL